MDRLVCLSLKSRKANGCASLPPFDWISMSTIPTSICRLLLLVVACSLSIRAQDPSSGDPLRLNVVFDDSLRTQPQVEVLGNLGGSLKVVPEGLLMGQPSKSEKIEGAGIRLKPDLTKAFGLQVHLDVQSHAKSRASKLEGLFIAFGSGDAPKTALGIVVGSRKKVELATTEDFSSMSRKNFRFQEVEFEIGVISVVKSGKEIVVSAGPDKLVMEELARFETTVIDVDVVDVIATAGATSNPTGKYLVKKISFVGDSYFYQPPPADYTIVWTIVKWLAMLGVLAVGIAVGVKYDLFRKKIF